MTKLRLALAAATTSVVGLLLPVALAVWTVPEPVIPELDRLANKDQPITLKLDRKTAAEALDAIAAAGGLRYSMEGPANGSMVDIRMSDVPLRRALELVAAQTDARYEVVSGDRLRVWLPETPIPGGEELFTMPMILKRVEPVYPKDARAAHAEGEVLLQSVIRADGTIGNVWVLQGAP